MMRVGQIAKVGLVLGVLGVLVAAVPASAATYDQTLYYDGLSRGTATYDSSTKKFTVRDTRADGFGVEVEWSYHGEAGVYRCYVGTGSGTSKSCSVASGKTLYWRMWTKDNGTYYSPPTSLYTHSS